jgi:ParB family transcriptional regulator, chromosome partitioning protein
VLAQGLARHRAVQRGRFREIETEIENPDAEPVLPCEAARSAIIVFGKRVGTTITVCNNVHCPVHDPRAAEAQAANPAPQMPPAPDVETDEEAAERKEVRTATRGIRTERERRAGEARLEEEQREGMGSRTSPPREATQARQAKFERIDHAPAMFSSFQLRVSSTPSPLDLACGEGTAVNDRLTATPENT